MRSCARLLLGLVGLLSLGTGAVAGERLVYGGHGPGIYGHGRFGGHGHGHVRGYGVGGYSFADSSVSGDYIGAPLTRFPRPSEIVPPAWGYGTYGVPTMTGIRQAPVGDPKVYVIHGVGRAALRGPREPWSDPASDVEAAFGGPRIVSVTVPRR